MFSIQSLFLLTAAALASLASAAPAKPKEARQFQAQLLFSGASASYTMSAPTDTTLFNTGNSLAVDQICSEGGATCSFHGVDGALVTVVGAHCSPVGPPQAIVYGSCLAL